MTPLKAYRQAHSLTLADVAPLIGVSDSQLSRIERNGTPLLEVALKLAALTKQPIELFTERAAQAQKVA